MCSSLPLGRTALITKVFHKSVPPLRHLVLIKYLVVHICPVTGPHLPTLPPPLYGSPSIKYQSRISLFLACGFWPLLCGWRFISLHRSIFPKYKCKRMSCPRRCQTSNMVIVITYHILGSGAPDDHQEC